MFLKNYFGCFGETYFFLICCLYRHPLSCVTEKQEGNKKKPKDVNLGRNDYRSSAAESCQLTARCGLIPMSPLGMSWWSAEDITEEGEAGKDALQGVVCSFLSTVKGID